MTAIRSEAGVIEIINCIYYSAGLDLDSLLTTVDGTEFGKKTMKYVKSR